MTLFTRKQCWKNVKLGFQLQVEYTYFTIIFDCFVVFILAFINFSQQSDSCDCFPFWQPTLFVHLSICTCVLELKACSALCQVAVVRAESNGGRHNSTPGQIGLCLTSDCVCICSKSVANSKYFGYMFRIWSSHRDQAKVNKHTGKILPRSRQT